MLNAFSPNQNEISRRRIDSENIENQIKLESNKYFPVEIFTMSKLRDLCAERWYTTRECEIDWQ